MHPTERMRRRVAGQAVAARRRRTVEQAVQRSTRGSGDGVIVLADMFGGTPSTLASSIKERAHIDPHPTMKVVSGCTSMIGVFRPGRLPGDARRRRESRKVGQAASGMVGGRPSTGAGESRSRAHLGDGTERLSKVSHDHRLTEAIGEATHDCR